jgi:large subunit ribosomal protein L33
LPGLGRICHHLASALQERVPVSEAPMAKKKGEKREIIRLVCTEDGKHYVTTSKNKQNTPDKLELMKFNSNLRKVTLHREKK